MPNSPPAAIDWARLADLARTQAARAYCPYSRFPVGAAAQTIVGQFHGGCNVENASYGLTICAERNAVFQAVSFSPAPLVLLAVAIYTPTPTPSAPCGACRQVLREFGPAAWVRSYCDGPDEWSFAVADLLPNSFGPESLGR